MRDKDYDDYFDEKSETEKPEKTLMSMIEDYDKNLKTEFKEGTKVAGKVASIGKDNIFVDINAKNEAFVALKEFLDEKGDITIKPGDKIEAYIVSVSDNEIMLSKSLSARKSGLSDLISLMRDSVPVQGKITGINKGGFNVNILGKKAFCPVSHIDLKYVDDPNEYLSRSLSFVITKVSESGRNIVLSRLPLLDQDLHKLLDELEGSAKSRKVYSGEITRVADFGLFVDLGGVEGLVHISEVSWDRTENIKETFTKGQKVECVVLKVEKRSPLKESKISLSIKQALDNPWLKVGEVLSVGQTVEGTITRMENFGAFIQLLPGIEGLIHISEMRWGERVRHPSDIVKTGDRVKVTIIRIDADKRSVSCTLKDLSDDPWGKVLSMFRAGSQAEGKVVSQTKFGFFIELAPGVTGLLANANVSPDKKKEIGTGSIITVVIDSIDTEARKISLSYGTHEPRESRESAEQYVNRQKKDQTKQSSEFGEMLKTALAKKERKSAEK